MAPIPPFADVGLPLRRPTIGGLANGLSLLARQWDAVLLFASVLGLVGLGVQHLWQVQPRVVMPMPMPLPASGSAGVNGAAAPPDLLACPLPLGLPQVGDDGAADEGTFLGSGKANKKTKKSKKRRRGSKKAAKPVLKGPVAINSASAATFQQLPGIGPALSQRIVADRQAHGPFASLDDLERVQGIGPKTLAKLRPHLKL